MDQGVCVRTTLSRCVRTLRNWSATSWRHLKDAIDASKPDRYFALRSAGSNVSKNASPEYRRKVRVSNHVLSARHRHCGLCRLPPYRKLVEDVPETIVPLLLPRRQAHLQPTIIFPLRSIDP